MLNHSLRAAFVLGIIVPFSAASVRAAEPANLSLRKQEVASYVATGEYAQDVGKVALAAHKYLSKRVTQASKPGQKLAIVFDIDETLLSNLPQMVANDYGYVPKVWIKWVGEARAQAIVPVQTVYDVAVRAQLAIFIITGREEAERVPTERNLRQVGYETWTRIYFRPAATEPPLTNAGFKTEMRRRLTEEGYTIVANLGDQASDLANGYAEKTFKLPNPFYLTK